MKKAIPQPIVAAAMRGRPLEKAMLHRRWVHRLVRGIGSVGLTLVVWPRLVAPYRWRLGTCAMPLRGLGAAFRGYRILHLTDLHTGRTRQKYLRTVIEQCVALKPDLIVMTGDLIHYHPRSLALLAELLPLLHAPDGVLAILGNHDYNEYSSRYTGARSAHRAVHKRLRRLLDESQVRLLINESQCIRRGGDDLWIVGVDDFWAAGFDPRRAFADVPAAAACICLEHNPDALLRLRQFNWQWMLCGHSHGGQVNVPVLGPMYVPMENRQWLSGLFVFDRGGYAEVSGDVVEHTAVERSRAFDESSERPAGESARDIQTMYVSRGIGYTAPFRMRAPPEATMFELYSR